MLQIRIDLISLLIIVFFLLIATEFSYKIADFWLIMMIIDRQVVQERRSEFEERDSRRDVE
jgi:hypothetical protein